MNLRLTSRIVLVFALLAAVLLATVGVLSYRSGSESLQAAVISEMLAIGGEKEAALNSWVDERLADLEQIASQPDVVEQAAQLTAAAPASAEARSAHDGLLRELEPHGTGAGSACLEVFVLEPEGGIVIASTSPAEEGKSKAGHPYFDQGRTGLTMQAPYRSADLSAPGMTAAVPLRATDGRVVAVLAARLDLAALSTIAQRRTGLHATEDSYLVNAAQLFVTQPRFISEPVVLRRKVDTEAARRCVARNSGVILTPDYRGVPVISVYRWIAKRQLGLLVEIDQSEALAPAHAFGRSVMLISILALLATAGLACLLARTITRPLRTLRDGVRRFAEGNTGEPLPESSGDEVGLLAREFNRTAARVGERTAELARTNQALQVENTERQRAEKDLRTSEARIRAITDSAQDAIVMMNPGGLVTYWNPAAERILGYTGAEALGQNLHNLIAPARFHPAHHAAFPAFLQTGKGAAVGKTIDLEARRKDQREISVQLSLSGVPIGGAWHAVGIIRDVTEGKRAEEELRESKHFIESVVDASVNFIYIFDLETRTHAYTNRSAREFLGYSQTQISELGDKFMPTIIHPDDLPRVARRLTQIAEVPDSRILEIEYRVKHANGDWRWIWTCDRIFKRRPNGVVWQIIGTAQDITGRKQAEAERARLAAILEATTDLVAIADPAGHLTYLNHAGRALLGVGPDEEITKTSIANFIPDPASHPILTVGIPAAIRLGTWAGETVLLSRGGQKIPVSQVILAHKSATGKLEFLSSIMRDMSGAKQAEEALDKAHQELVEVSRQAGMAEIATGVLHNVGNVLNSVNVSANLLSEQIRKTPVASLGHVVALLREQGANLGAFFTSDPRGPKVPEFLSKLADNFLHVQASQLRETASLQKNIEHIKDIVAMQQGYARVYGVTESLIVTDLVEDALRINSAGLRRHEVQVVREFAPDMPAITTEKHKILQILVNLMSNAKYACDNSGHLEKRITVRVAHAGGRVQVQISDNGVGILPENLARIFNLGFTTKKAGHGFGLHSAANAAKEIGGSLTVQSDGPGRGATFTLELPVVRRAEVAAVKTGLADDRTRPKTETPSAAAPLHP